MEIIKTSEVRAGILGLAIIFFLGFFSGCVLLDDPTYYLDITVINEEGGSVHKDPEEDEYLEGTKVTLTAVPADGWEFEEWKGDEEGTDEVLEVEMDEDKEITAVFVREEYSLKIEKEGEGEVEKEVLSTPAGGHAYETVIELTAVPADGWEFEEWKGDEEGTDEVIEIKMDEDKEITAVFVREEYSLKIEKEGEGEVEKEVLSTPAGGHAYETVIELTAVPADGWEFEEWKGDEEGTDEVIEIKMDENKEINAVFVEKKYSSTIRVHGVEKEDHLKAFSLKGDNFDYNFSKDDFSQEDGTLLYITEEILQGEENIELEVDNDVLTDFYYTFNDGMEKDEGTVSYFAPEINFYIDNQLKEIESFSGIHMEGLDIIFIEEGKVKIKNYHSLGVLDLEEGILTEGKHTDRNSNSINIDLDKGFISRDGDSLIIDFGEESLQDNRIENRGEAIKLTLLDEEGNVVSLIKVEVDIEVDENY